jgi:hypothetical protein
MKAEISLSQAQELARSATQKELSNYEVAADLMGQVVLTTLFEGDDRVFVLYVPGETRQDQMIVARTTVNVKTGELFVDVPVLSRKAN